MFPSISKPINIHNNIKRSSPYSSPLFGSTSIPSLHLPSSLSSSFSENVLQNSKENIEQISQENLELLEKVKRLVKRIEIQISDTEILKEEFETLSRNFSSIYTKKKNLLSILKSIENSQNLENLENLENINNLQKNVKISSLTKEFIFVPLETIENIKNFHDLSNIVYNYFENSKTISSFVSNGNKYDINSENSEKLLQFFEDVKKSFQVHFIYSL